MDSFKVLWNGFFEKPIPLGDGYYFQFSWLFYVAIIILFIRIYFALFRNNKM